MAKEDEKEAEGDAKGGGRKRLIIIALPVVVLVVAAAAWFLVLKPKDDSAGAAAALPAPKPGTVVPLESITVNLAASHFLKVGIALQPTADATEVDGSKALDQLITVFSNDTIDSLSEPEGKDAAKKELVARIKLAYLPEEEITEEEIVKANEDVSGGKVKETNDLSAAEAEKRAAELKVQPLVYDVYFTEFVMQ
ncbi:flagellar basal body-associated FliL family protein [Kineosporia babensis]|uniref:Flagellar protein FliL n=1 Tax=Kineosporia babensis TaxID=499548 RepID=A0A9X1N7H2_9ACTN|nr:flagellar basal body-associated FliL family protein [Kineosporia babensis]MCD5309842.1 flagellar basal body-associated FliL family protein [Kineosporia babensis]